jgi:hypothetical protein
MRFFILTLLTGFIFVCCNSQRPADSVNGTQVISNFFLSPATGGKFIKQPMLPDIEIWYYKNYLVERFFNVKKISYRDQSDKTGIAYDTMYNFIDMNGKTCITYNRFSKDATGSTPVSLNDKKNGINFNKTADTSFDQYYSNRHLKDTIVDEISYKYFRTMVPVVKNSNSLAEVTVYLIAGNDNLKSSPFHLNKKIEKEYNGIVVRMDAKNVEKDEEISMRMKIIPNNLSKEQIAVFESWIQSGKQTN